MLPSANSCAASDKVLIVLILFCGAPWVDGADGDTEAGAGFGCAELCCTVWGALPANRSILFLAISIDLVTGVPCCHPSQILGKSEVIKAITRFVNRMRKALRENDQGLDGFLYRFNYTTTLAHPDNEDIGSNFYWRSKQIFDEEAYNQFSPQQETGVK